MLITDGKIVSPVLVQTALSNHIPIYYLNDERPLNLKVNSKMLTTSEDCLDLLEKNDSNHPNVRASKLVKNKAEFRKISSSLNEDFFYRLFSIEELLKVNKESIPYPVVIKPNKGYGSVGVYIVKEENDWVQAVQDLYCDILLAKNIYSDTVVDSDQIIIEEWIEGDEYALDCYFDNRGIPVILNILKRRFANDKDTSDRIYYTSSEIIKEVQGQALEYLQKLNEEITLKNYPFHIEVRRTRKGIVPIEMNPLRFAGVGTTDVSYHAFNINASESYFLDAKPEWEPIINRPDQSLYGFFCAEIPNNISINLVESINHTSLEKEFSEVLEYREIESTTDRTFAVIFFKARNIEEIDRLLQLDLSSYINLKKVKEAVK
ncbi:ATP-grasp domain-containing protein [Halobacillus dabanensis]|uniref:ATP-grasp domain-containing protein n=1 Tax=Halobacillus dabanensis TaxID=240302 RepID=A0A1I3UI14_HALDA|nr:ATP-grasp domain-containing protein [Halobacillus dabanensis]SFJ82505.1 ATP-grasp domain-containing protein [Halobacillus dabanensis]